MSRYRRYNDGNGGKIVAFIVAIVLILCTVLGIVYREHVAIIWGDVSRYFGRVNEETQEDDEPTEDETPNEDDEQSGAEKTSSFLPGDVENNGVALTVARLSAAEVSAQAESGFTVTATVLPEYATDKTLDWEISFVDTSDSWTTGKNCADYVTVTPTADGAATAVMENLQPFNSQMLLTVRSRSNPEVYSTVTLDYRRRAIGAYMELKNAAGKTVKRYDMNSGELKNELITNGICGGLLPSGSVLLSEGTIGTADDYEVSVNISIVRPIVSYLQDNKFAFAFYASALPALGYNLTDEEKSNIEIMDLKYLALYMQWKEYASVYGGSTLQNKYYGMTWSDYKALRGSEYLSVVNGYTDVAYKFVVVYKLSGSSAVGEFVQVNFSYQEDYFPISVESVETDTGNVEF